MKLTEKYWTFRKGIATHISRTGYSMTLCALKMDSENFAYNEEKKPDCPICIKEYEERTGEKIVKQNTQTSLF